MSVLDRNLKKIRKELKCSQSAMADILKVGFRTYIRYESGERAAPVWVLVKAAKLGNISLEQLLTTEISRLDITPGLVLPENNPPPVVKRCDFRAGTISFKKPSTQRLVATDGSERRLLSIFRKMEPDVQETCLEHVNNIFNKAPKKASETAGAARAVKARKGESLRHVRLKGVAMRNPKIKKRNKSAARKPSRKKTAG
ncbi:MAG: helix-turn-helix domain-containing protein [Nitrospinales bacterium]